MTPRDVVPLSRGDLLWAIAATLRGEDLPATRAALRVTRLAAAGLGRPVK